MSIIIKLENFDDFVLDLEYDYTFDKILDIARKHFEIENLFWKHDINDMVLCSNGEYETISPICCDECLEETSRRNYNYLYSIANKGLKHKDCFMYAHRFNNTQKKFNSNKNAVICGALRSDRSMYDIIEIVELGYPINSGTLFITISYDRKDFIKYILSNYNFTKDELYSGMSTAAYNGNIYMIKELRKYGSEWDEEISRRAADGGNLECLRYLIESECPYDLRCRLTAENEYKKAVLCEYYADNYKEIVDYLDSLNNSYFPKITFYIKLYVTWLYTMIFNKT